MLNICSTQTRDLVHNLIAEGQQHLFEAWPPLGQDDDKKKELLNQLCHLDRSYAGGLLKYIQNAKRLLTESKDGVNPFEGCTPSVPEGESLDYGSEEFREFERVGIEAAGEAAFVLVAGGLGERLGYSGIKVALPSESASNTCFLQLYIESILALQAKAQVAHPGRTLPLAIMTSDDTHSATQSLLGRNNYFGAKSDQIVLIKQEKVACISDNEGRLALDPKNNFRIQTKPHGHGDVHMLLHQSGIAQKWKSSGLQWVCFFQDTNVQAFRSIPVALGVSSRRNFAVNSLAVPRKAKEAIGAITKLQFPNGREITINVEYNQLDPLLRATINEQGDVNDPKTGFSPFPGNINQLILKLDTYVEELDRHGGVIAEFVNPKYADASRTAFKSSTRLECMMQDFPKTLPENTPVGFTTINQVWAAYSPVKNSPVDAAAKAASGNPSHSATASELDVYEANCRMLQTLGAQIEEPTEELEFNGIKGLKLWPRITWSPLFALTFDDLASKVNGPGLRIGGDTTMVIQAPDLYIKRMDLNRGSLVIKGCKGAEITVDGLVVENEGWLWEAISQSTEASEADKFPEEERIRGFTVVKKQTKDVDYEETGTFKLTS